MEPSNRKLESASTGALTGGTEPRMWRSIEEISDDDQFFAALRREFPEYANRLNDGATRRQFLQLMGASLALAGVSGCVEQPQEKIVPFVQAPEQLVPGKPLYYATAMTLDGAAIGLLVESQMGRPVKIEGNPLHPAVPEIMADAPDNDRVRFGASDAFAQAAVLSLYDPDRSQTVLRGGQIDTWESFVAQLQTRLRDAQANGGRGVRLLTETVVSPTLADQLRQFLESYPNAEWHQYEPLHRDNELLGSRLAFDADVTPLYHIERADIVLSLDADFLSVGPMHLQHARGFASRRRFDPDANAASQAMNRLYVVESGVTTTGAAADHRWPCSPRAVSAIALRLAAALGLEFAAGFGSPIADEPLEHWLGALVQDLQQARGRSLVLVGRGQPTMVHAVAHWMNSALDNVGQTVEYRESVAARADVQTESLQQLVQAMRNQEVHTLVILDGNPVFDAPANVGFAAALTNVSFSAHLSQYDDETSARCGWHVPELHFLESWSDTRAADGTVSIVQPLIAPLHEGKSAYDVLSAMLLRPPVNGYEIVRAYRRERHATTADTNARSAFETFWQTALHDGVVAGTQAPAASQAVRADFADVLNQQSLAASPPAAARSAGEKVSVVFQPDPSVWDGRFANNGWLQELPRPLTTLTWDNAALLARATAEALSVRNGDVVEITVELSTIKLPVLIVPGHPEDVVTLHVGYGRDRVGRIGNGVGTNVYSIRNSGAMWHVDEAAIRPTGERQLLARTQHHHLMEGRDLVRAGTFAALQANPEHPAFMVSGHHAPAGHAADAPSMYPPHPYDGYKWGMVVNQSACIGCNACVVACQAENNIPIVGKDQVSRGREMHWLRIDHYYEGPPENPTHYHQPMLCQHCELAPCEPVCPVAATTHSSEGLNEMTYNRCIGTRYCSNNCPYKVRRFNFLDYNAPLRQEATLQLLPNPDVTVRSRGVMEKCTYCVQRINAGRIQAEIENRSIRDGDVVTACQAACPTEAIVFGDLNDNASLARQQSISPLNYSVLGELNTRPRTTYLAAVRNPNPRVAIEGATAGLPSSVHPGDTL